MAVGYSASLPKPISWPELAAQLEKHLPVEWLYEEATDGPVVEAETVLPL